MFIHLPTFQPPRTLQRDAGRPGPLACSESRFTENPTSWGTITTVPPAEGFPNSYRHHPSSKSAWRAQRGRGRRVLRKSRQRHHLTQPVRRMKGVVELVVAQLGLRLSTQRLRNTMRATTRIWSLLKVVVVCDMRYCIGWLNRW